MSFYYEWIDFVNYPDDPNKVTTKEVRLDCSKAVRIEKESANSIEESNSQADLIGILGWVITQDRIIFEDDDAFEVMEITESGRIIIFTKKRVWTLQRQGEMERLIFLPRHPQFSHFEAEFNK